MQQVKQLNLPLNRRAVEEALIHVDTFTSRKIHVYLSLSKIYILTLNRVITSFNYATLFVQEKHFSHCRMQDLINFPKVKLLDLVEESVMKEAHFHHQNL